MPPRLLTLLVWTLLVLLLSTHAIAAVESTAASVSSPNKILRIVVSTDNDRRPIYSVYHGDQSLVSASRLGFVLVDAPKLERHLHITQQTQSHSDQTWEQPWGERKTIRNHYNELRVTFAETQVPQRSFDVVFRVYDDGLGFRYEFPKQDALTTVAIGEELTEFNLTQSGTAWWLPAGEWNRAEYLYNRTPINQIGSSQTPLTLRNQDGLHLSIHEAALVDYAGMNLQRVEGQRFKAALTNGGNQSKVVRQAPFNTPWRTLQVADNAGGLVTSSLVLNLNEPNKLGDVSWVKPMKYVGVWWEMHLGKKTWASGPMHGASNENVMRHIDFAAQYGFDGVLVEGWNIGWDGDWFGNGQDFSFTQAYPDFDLEKLTAYAKRKGVVLIGHHETSANAAHYESQMEDAFKLYQHVGVPAVKTGYVSDAGQAKVIGEDGQPHYAWHEGQAMSRHYLKVVTAAAKHHIAINTHEPIKDTGLRRTYPNWIAREGARGMEYNAWGEPGNPPEHEANLVFTRLLAGPMDFTPGIFSMQTKSGQPMATTLAKQLALYVVIYSPIQMAADLPENYQANLKPFQFIRDVPVDWDDTRVLNGEVGDYVTIVRKDRHSQDWYLGAISDETARELNVSLSFLTAGKRYNAQIYRDGDPAGWLGDQKNVVIETRRVSNTDKLSLKLAPGGGQAIRFVAE